MFTDTHLLLSRALSASLPVSLQKRWPCEPAAPQGSISWLDVGSPESQRASWAAGHPAAQPSRNVSPSPAREALGAFTRAPRASRMRTHVWETLNQIPGLCITPRGEGGVLNKAGGAVPPPLRGPSQAAPSAGLELPLWGFPGSGGVCDRACALSSSWPPCKRPARAGDGKGGRRVWTPGVDCGGCRREDEEH